MMRGTPVVPHRGHHLFGIEPRSDAMPGNGFEVAEASIADVHAAMAAGEVTAAELTAAYLDRIERLDDDLSAIITVNPNANSRAEELDRTLAESGPAGPLHGIPVILKDNFDTADLPTTAGSTTLSGVHPPDDGTIVRRIREAGGIVLAKANLHEFAYGWTTVSSLGGHTRNPYDTDRVPGGSSGGTAAAIAANLGLVGTGSDTCGSVRVPPAFTNLVGIRATAGLVSRDGLVPMSRTQDVPGPITRTVRDAAILMDVFAGFDPADPATARGARRTPAPGDPLITTWPGAAADGGSYTAFLTEDGLDGARIGVLREYLETDGEGRAVTAVVEDALAEVDAAGATVVDPVSPAVDVDPEVLQEMSVIQYEFRRELNGYLAGLDDPDAPADLREIADSGEPVPGVLEVLERDLEVDVDELSDNAEYLRRLARRGDFDVLDRPDTRPSLRDAVLSLLEADDLDAIAYPTVSQPPVAVGEDQPRESVNCALSACSGLPAITVPAGFTADPPGLPVGLELLGRPFAEPRLIELASAYERATGHRRSPDRG